MSQAYRFEQVSPESQGIASESILSFIDSVEAQLKESHSFMLLRHGKLVAEGWWSPYHKDYKHSLYSLSKSFSSTAVGLAIEEGYFSLDDSVVSLFPDDLPSTISDNLAKMKLRHLLSMSTGHDSDTMSPAFERADGNWSKGILSVPVVHEPGSHFVYNSGASYLLSALVQAKTGLKLIDYLQSRLFEPLGIENPSWEECPRGINVGGWGLSIRTEDIAAFGQLYLQKGVWNDKRILSEEWVREATAYQVSNGEDESSDWAQGYGFQFWRCRHNAYRGDGAFGQYCIVMPEQDAVLALTGGLPEMQVPLNIVWDTLLAGMRENALPENPSSFEKLSHRLADLKLPTVAGKHDSGLSTQFSGKTYQLAGDKLPLERLTVDFADGKYGFRLKTVYGEEAFTAVYGSWKKGESSLFKQFPWDAPSVIVASAAWISETSFRLIIRLIETPFFYTLDFLFRDDGLELEAIVNVGFIPPKTLRVTAKPV